MITNKQIDLKPEQPSAEKERLELARSLGLPIQDSVAEKKTEWQIREAKKNEWIGFRDIEYLSNFLFEKHGLFKGKGFFGKPYDVVREHMHLIHRYPQRIPMSVLLKLKEAKETDLFHTFYIIDPDIRSEKCDPFLVGMSKNWPSENACTLICSWFDKSE